jgi:hypothetical protein
MRLGTGQMLIHLQPVNSLSGRTRGSLTFNLSFIFAAVIVLPSCVSRTVHIRPVPYFSSQETSASGDLRLGTGQRLCSKRSVLTCPLFLSCFHPASLEPFTFDLSLFSVSHEFRVRLHVRWRPGLGRVWDLRLGTGQRFILEPLTFRPVPYFRLPPIKRLALRSVAS